MIMSYADWQARGTVYEVLGHRLFVVDEGPRDAPVIAVLHGFPSASYDFWRVLPALAAKYRVIVHDHVGFGFSEKPPRYSYSILDQAQHALALWQQLGATDVHVLAHDYGCSVATELFALRERGQMPVQLRSATLVNSGLYYHMAGLRLAQHLLRLKLTRSVFSRLSNRGMYRLNLRRLWGRQTPDLDAELDILWEMTARENGKLALGWLSHYLEERRYIHTERWNQAIRSFDVPAHVLWGDLDPVGIPAIAERLARELPQAQLTWLRGVGHYPMLEAPADFARQALRFIDAQPSPPA
jgi:pimeloyl-ACP methyl ester carboxylesterase